MRAPSTFAMIPKVMPPQGAPSTRRVISPALGPMAVWCARSGRKVLGQRATGPRQAGEEIGGDKAISTTFPYQPRPRRIDKSDVQNRIGWALCRAGDLSLAAALSLCLWGGAQPNKQ